MFPDGYTQRRLTRFGRMMGNDHVQEEGWMETNHEVILREGTVLGELCWLVHNTVTLKAEFREGSPLLKNDGASIFLQSLERTVPCVDGVKNYVQYVSGSVIELHEVLRGVFRSWRGDHIASHSYV